MMTGMMLMMMAREDSSNQNHTGQKSYGKHNLAVDQHDPGMILLKQYDDCSSQRAWQ